MRHGRKSASKTFNGHKTAVAVDMDSQLICGVEVLAGNAGDQEKALDLVHQAERVMEAQVEETVGDCAYGGGPTRKAFADEQRLLTAKVPTSHNGECFPKSAFAIDLDRMEVRCPAGKTKTRFQVIMAAVVANLSLVVCFCHHEHKPAMNTTDPEIQALLTPTDAQSGFLADAWISCVRLQYFLLQHVLFGLLANPASS